MYNFKVYSFPLAAISIVAQLLFDVNLNAQKSCKLTLVQRELTETFSGMQSSCEHLACIAAAALKPRVCTPIRSATNCEIPVIFSYQFLFTELRDGFKNCGWGVACARGAEVAHSRRSHHRGRIILCARAVRISLVPQTPPSHEE